MFLGMDTSCYTTSVAAFDQNGMLLADKRKLLSVKTASCGLRQSDMVFQHMKNLPELFESLPELQGKIKAVCVSSKPRPVEDSYMPAFLAGLSFARVIAASTGAKLYFTSHQQNHIEAGLWSAAGPKTGSFIVLHVSGGTTDLLIADKTGDGLKVREIGCSMDISAGQFIDRVGVLLGLDFPCGKALETMALEAVETVILPVAVKDLNVSYSGPLTAAKKLIEKGASKAELAAGVQLAIAKSFVKLLENACLFSGSRQILLVGGVSSNMYIKTYLLEKFIKKEIDIYFPDAVYCLDNAVGCAWSAFEKWRNDIG